MGQVKNFLFKSAVGILKALLITAFILGSVFYFLGRNDLAGLSVFFVAIAFMYYILRPVVVWVRNNWKKAGEE